MHTLWKVTVALIAFHVNALFAIAGDPAPVQSGPNWALVSEGVAALFSIALVLGLVAAFLRSLKSATADQSFKASEAWESVAAAERARNAQLLLDVESLKAKTASMAAALDSEHKERELERRTYLAQLAAKDELIAQLKQVKKDS
jgi:hypothetical protein